MSLLFGNGGSQMAEVAKLLGHYEAGRLTVHELLLRLCQAAAEQSPARLAAELPTEVLDAVRERAAAPPATPGQCRVFGSVCAGPGFDAEAHFREESRRLYDGLWRWHRYFAEAGADAAPDPAG